MVSTIKMVYYLSFNQDFCTPSPILKRNLDGPSVSSITVLFSFFLKSSQWTQWSLKGIPLPPAVSLLPSLLCHLPPVVIAQLPLTLAPVHDQSSHLLMVFPSTCVVLELMLVEWHLRHQYSKYISEGWWDGTVSTQLQTRGDVYRLLCSSSQWCLLTGTQFCWVGGILFIIYKCSNNNNDYYFIIIAILLYYCCSG